ncbi:hypothetical protein PPYR_12673 [Photinus pyralis]|uniref:DUF4806 domain-containing protein n=1 Tax=Photinus pyralis TaxID=7054 RepID=A0A5N4A6W2_PHOPY|nr:hypothetical protein PPYR_12673 [Photinus pyralis]
MNFSVLEFDDGTVELVPNNWITGDSCSWPPTLDRSSLNKLVLSKTTPENSWNIYATYERGTVKLKLAMEMSDIDTESDTLKKSRHSRHSKMPSSECDGVNVNKKRRRTTILPISSDSEPGSDEEPSTDLPALPDTPEDFNLLEVPKHPKISRHKQTSSQTLFRKSTNTDVVSHCRLSRSNTPLSNVSHSTLSKGIDTDDVVSHCRLSRSNTPLSNVSHSTLSKGIETDIQHCTPSRSNTPTSNLSYLSRDAEVKIITKLNTLISITSSIVDRQNLLEQSLGALQGNTSDVPMAPIGLMEFNDKFPLTTEDDLVRFDEDLKDKEFFNKMVTTLCSFGGTDVTNITVNILRKVISNKVANSYSLLGKKKKKKFKELNFFNLIIETVRRQKPGATETEIGGVVGSWLPQSNLRLSRELKKQNQD